MSFKSVFMHEIDVCFRGRWFFIALFLAVGVSMAAAIESAAHALEWHALDSFYLSNFSSYSNWIVVNCNGRALPPVFFRLLPLFAVMPFAWSYHAERIAGYDSQVFIRANRISRMAAKAAVAFLAAFVVTGLSLLVNFAALSCLLPAYAPVYEEYSVIGVFTESLFSQLFYTRPFLFVIAFTLLDALIMGAWAVLVLGLSAVFSNRVSVMVFPYLLLLGWQYFNSWIFGVSILYGPSANIIDDMQATFFTVRSESVIVVAEIALMLAIGVAGSYRLAQGDVD